MCTPDQNENDSLSASLILPSLDDRESVASLDRQTQLEINHHTEHIIGQLIAVEGLTLESVMWILIWTEQQCRVAMKTAHAWEEDQKSLTPIYPSASKQNGVTSIDQTSRNAT